MIFYMAGVIFYELFIVFGLPLYYTAIKSSYQIIPTHTHTFYIIHDIFHAGYFIHEICIHRCVQFRRKIYITHLPIHQIIHTLCLPCFNYKIPARKPHHRKMNRRPFHRQKPFVTSLFVYMWKWNYLNEMMWNYREITPVSGRCFNKFIFHFKFIYRPP